MFENTFTEDEIEILLRGHGTSTKKQYTALCLQEVERYTRYCFDDYPIRKVAEGEVIGIIRYKPLKEGELGAPMLKPNPSKMSFKDYLNFR